MDKIKVLNLYAGIGGNRKLWPNDVIDVTAIENNKDISIIYKRFFPDDNVIVDDAHKYLLKHYKDFDFIWSSPPCPTHSRLELLHEFQGCEKRFPDMRLYEEIIFLQYWFKGKYAVENVISYYDPLIKPYIVNNHYIWSNFIISSLKQESRGMRENMDFMIKKTGFDIRSDKNVDKRKALNNCTEPKIGLHIFNCAFKEKQHTLI